jgi:hypothetical protein
MESGYVHVLYVIDKDWSYVKLNEHCNYCIVDVIHFPIQHGARGVVHLGVGSS